MQHPDNAGLDVPIDDLQPIVDTYGNRGLNRPDVWALAALVATEVAQPDNNADNANVDLSLKWFGRSTCGSDDPSGGPERDLCHGSAGTATVRTFFSSEFSFTDRQMVAIMGAHSVGRMRQQDTGNVGFWDLTRDTLDTGYYAELTGLAPDFELVNVDNSAIPGVDDKVQWEGVHTDTGDTVTMLNSDIALVRDLPDAEDVSCVWTFDGTGDNACSPTTPFAEQVDIYARNSQLFLEDFADVLNLMIDHGHTKGNNCLLDGGGSAVLCRFDP